MDELKKNSSSKQESASPNEAGEDTKKHDEASKSGKGIDIAIGYGVDQETFNKLKKAAQENIDDDQDSTADSADTK